MRLWLGGEEETPHPSTGGKGLSRAIETSLPKMLSSHGERKRDFQDLFPLTTGKHY